MEGAWATRSGDMSRQLTQATLNGVDLASHTLIQILQPNLFSNRTWPLARTDRGFFRATDIIAWNLCPLTKTTTDPLRRRRTGDGGI